MDIAGRTALVTGANRGLGRHLAEQLRDRGANVYAAARNPAKIDLEGVSPITLDIVDPSSIQAAVAATDGISILINNAGSSTYSSVLTGTMENIRSEIEVHYFGTLQVIRALAPQLAANPDGAYLLNILSGLSWVSFAETGAYCVGESAKWSMTNAIRQELAPQGVRVGGLHVGYMDTDLVKGVDAPKSDPADVAAKALDGIEADSFEIVADEISGHIRAGLAGGVGTLYPDLAVA